MLVELGVVEQRYRAVLEVLEHGGIILTGGGAQLKNIIQLTEYVTGLGARLGYPNEHLAGGHAEALNNPMYATCIGLILRGYHDFEAGRLRFVGEGGNIIHLGGDEPIEVSHDVAGVQKPETPVADESQDSDLISEAEERAHRRGVRFGKLFDGLKNKFMGLFEEVEDKEME